MYMVTVRCMVLFLTAVRGAIVHSTLNAAWTINRGKSQSHNLDGNGYACAMEGTSRSLICPCWPLRSLRQQPRWLWVTDRTIMHWSSMEARIFEGNLPRRLLKVDKDNKLELTSAGLIAGYFAGFLDSPSRRGGLLIVVGEWFVRPTPVLFVALSFWCPCIQRSRVFTDAVFTYVLLTESLLCSFSF